MFSFSVPIYPESGEAALCEIVAGESNQSECQDCSNTDFKHKREKNLFLLCVFEIHIITQTNTMITTKIPA